MICEVVTSDRVRKELRTVPRNVAVKLQAWIDDVEANGLEQVRKRPGFHDEPLQGQRKGQRSIRLSRAWRAIYVIRESHSVEFVLLQEVNKHDY